MPSILDLLKMKQQPQVAAAINVQELQQAKTGKALPGGEAATPVSNIGVQMANQQAATQQRQVAQQAGMVQAGQEQQAAGQQAQFAQESAANAQKEKQSKEALDIEAATQDAHNKVFKEAMASEQLRTKLNRKAEQEGWTSQQRFEDSLQTDIFGQTRSNLFKNLGVRNALAMDQRDWEDAMAEMGATDLLKVADAEIKASNQKAVIESGGKAGVAAVTYAVSEDKEDKTVKTNR